ncbi:MAG: DUF3857 domain-containing protein [Acidobacteria bacterium]|nr:DUF3857 domain-containing protein [Acidobacteriota bacterium]
MRLKSSLLLLVAACLCACFFLQSTSAQDKDWRPLSADDAAAAKPVVDPDADAEALLWEVKIDDSGEYDLSMRHYIRVKIFTERGREKYSKFDIPYTHGLQIKDLAARVIKPDGSIIEIKKDDIFDREIIKASGVKIKAKSFAVPNIEPGVIVEYRYKEVYSDTGASGYRLEFQKDIPVRTLTYYYKPFGGREPAYRRFNFDDVTFVKDKGGFYVASKTNVPAFKEERNMPPEDMVRPWVRLGSGHMLFGDNVKVEIAKLMKDAASGDIKKTALQVVGNAATDDEKIARIYAYCQSEISNTTYDPTITEEMRAKLPKITKLSDVIKKKQADAGDIDLLFGSMAISLGLDAHIAWIGDRSKMFIEPVTTVDSFLHPGAIAIKSGSGWKFYNPGTKFLPIGQLIWFEEDNWSEIISENNFLWVKTPYTDYSGSLSKRTGKFRLLEDGSLTGTVSMEVQGQQAVQYRVDNYDESSQKLESMLTDDVKRQFTTAEVSAVKVENVTDGSKPLIFSYEVKIPGYAQKTGKRLFLQPSFFEYGVPAVFASDTRKYDIFFRYPWSEKDDITIELPKGFLLDNPDAPAKVADTSGVASLTTDITVNESSNTLHYKRDFFFGSKANVYFKKEFYKPLKTLFDRFSQADAHTITLKQQ